MKKRKDAVTAWLAQQFDDGEYCLQQQLAGDASFRRYYRVFHRNKRYIVMDAPPEKEKPDAFFRVARLMQYYGLPVPDCHAFEGEYGFILLEDLGDQQLAHVLSAANAEYYYKAALQLMCQQLAIPARLVPDYTYAKLVAEQQLMRQWFYELIGLQESTEEAAIACEAFHYLANQAALQPTGFVHRDFHCRNIMVQADKRLVLIDFQDAVRGPITYDLAGLLKDCYQRWPASQIRNWVDYYYQCLVDAGHIDTDRETFFVWFEHMALQRHLKCLGLFARLYQRDGKAAYLPHLPRIIDYIEEVLPHYKALAPLAGLWFRRIRPLVEHCQFT